MEHLHSFVRLSVHPSVGEKNLDQLYSSINQHRTTANLTDIVWCISGGVWSMSGGVWCCLVLADACLVVVVGTHTKRVFNEFALRCKD